MKYIRILIITLIFFKVSTTWAQQKLVLDQIVGNVADHIILSSDIEMQCQQRKLQGADITAELKCQVFEELLFRKLLLVQAEKDSLTVNDAQVEAELERRFRYFIAQFGSVESFENFYGKKVDQYKEDFRQDVHDMLLSQQMQSKILGTVTVSPNDVRSYFNSLPSDSIPFVNAQVEIAEIVKKPAVNPELKKYTKTRIEELRERAVKGEDFDFLVKSYSEDPGSNGRGGAPTKYQNIQRGTFVPEFDQYAFSLKTGEISPVFETSYGFHFMKLIARKGEMVDLQHVLIAVPIDPEDLLKAKTFLDSISIKIKADSISFTEAASRFSDDEDSKINGGTIMNPMTGDLKFEMDKISQIDPALVLTVDKLNTGEISQPVLMQTRDAKQAYRILTVKSRTQPHKANLKDDYLLLQNQTQSVKQAKIINDWINKKLSAVYVKVNGSYTNCKFKNGWIKKS